MATGAAVEVRVHADKARAALRRLPREVEVRTNREGRTFAQLAARRAGSRAPVGPAEGGHLRDDAYEVASVSRETAAAVARYDRRPYGGWIDFGGTRIGRGGGAATRPFRRGGRIFYPAIRESARLFRRSGPKIAGQAIRHVGLT